MSPFHVAPFAIVAAVGFFLGVFVFGQPVAWEAAEAAVDDPDGAILAMAMISAVLLALGLAGKAALRWGPIARGRRGRGRSGGERTDGAAAREDEADWST